MASAGRTRIFLNNSVAAAINQIILMICGFILPRVMLIYYGSELNGLVTSISQFISYFSLVEAGLAGSAVYALYKPLAQKNYCEVNGIVSAAKRFYLQSGYIFSILVITLAFFFPIIIKTQRLSSLQIMLLVFVLGMRGCLEFFTLAKYRVLLTADQKFYVLSIVTSVSIILNTVLVSIFAYFQFDIILVLTLSLFAYFIRPVLLRWYVKHNYFFIDFNQRPNSVALDKRWDAFYSQILGSVQNGAPVILATFFTSLSMVSVYSIFNMVMGGVNSILSIFTSGLSSSFGDVLAKYETEVLQKAVEDFEYAYYFLITIVYSVCFLTIMPFIKIFTVSITDTDYNLPIFGFLMVINGYLYSVKVPQGMLVISAGLYKETRLQVTVQALIILIGGIVAAPIWGLYGIIISVCLSNIYRDIDLLFFIPKYVTKLPVKNSAMRILWSLLTIFVIVLPSISYQFSPNSLFEWCEFTLCITFWASFSAILSSLLFQNFHFYSILRRIRGMLSK